MKKDLTPRERLTILVLRQSARPLSLLEIMQATQFKSTQPFRVSLRYLVTTGELVETNDENGQAVYACTPSKLAALSC